MRALRRTLYVQAVITAAAGIALVAGPGPFDETVFGHVRATDPAWVRVAGAEAFALSLFMVLVANRIEELWWWSWGFVIGATLIAIVSGANLAGGLPSGSSAALWWTILALHAVFALALLYGIARAAGERPP